MTERRSQVILLIEIIVFLAPLTFYSVWWGVVLVPKYVHAIANEVAGQPLEAYVIPLSLVAAIVLQSIAWFVSYRFLVGGRSALGQVNRNHIRIITTGAGLVVLGLVLTVLDGFGYEVSVYNPFFSVMTMGAPALVPFTHIMIERYHGLGKRAK